MSPANRADLDPEDYFQETRMSFGDHIEELRGHLLKAIYGFVICLVGSLFVASYVLDMIAKPVEQQLKFFYERRAERVAEDLKNDPANLGDLNKPTDFLRLDFPRQQFIAAADPKIPNDQINKFAKPEEDVDVVSLWIRHPEPLRDALAMRKATEMLGRRHTLSTLRVEEGFMVYFKVAMLTGFVFGSPWIFYQIWSFVAAGLYQHEKKYVNIYLPFSLVLFLAGAAVCQFAVIPKAIEALLWFNEWLGLEPDLRLNDWLNFALLMPVVFGLSFQTPLVMLFLEKVGLVPVEVFARRRRAAWFVLALVSAVITPSVDAFSMLFLWVPLVLLYELGIFLCRLSPRDHSPFEDEDAPESEEMVEV